MKKILNKVTVTGADDVIDGEELKIVHKQFPFVEFGILVSESNFMRGAPRFPSSKWINLYPQGLPTAVHLCGSWVREILSGFIPQRVREVIEVTGAQRVQLNTHGIKHRFSGTFDRVVEAFPANIIFQLDEANDDLHHAMASLNSPKVFGLHDLSHGAGVLPVTWPPQVPGIKTGYAGGLSPENVSATLLTLEDVVAGETWIDAETHLRSMIGGSEVFDIAKVKRFLAAAQPWVI